MTRSPLWREALGWLVVAEDQGVSHKPGKKTAGAGAQTQSKGLGRAGLSSPSHRGNPHISMHPSCALCYQHRTQGKAGLGTLSGKTLSALLWWKNTTQLTPLLPAAATRLSGPQGAQGSRLKVSYDLKAEVSSWESLLCLGQAPAPGGQRPWMLLSPSHIQGSLWFPQHHACHRGLDRESLFLLWLLVPLFEAVLGHWPDCAKCSRQVAQQTVHRLSCPSGRPLLSLESLSFPPAK